MRKGKILGIVRGYKRIGLEVYMIKDFILYQNYPNPFNPQTVISYKIRVRGNVVIKINDVLGKEIATLVNEDKSVGSYEVEFDDRYEGIVNYQVGARNLELISFLSNIEEFSEHDTLKVEFYLKDSISALIIAEDTEGELGYLMLSKDTSWKQGWNAVGVYYLLRLIYTG